MNRYLYEQIYDELKKEIVSGTYRTGDWFPPERVLKERFNTTHITVRNALAMLVLEGYIERYSGKGTVVIYSRERVAAPRRLRFPWACLVVPDLGELNAALSEALEARLRPLPLALRVSCHHGDVLLCRALHREAQKDGALVVLDPAGTLRPFEDANLPIQSTILLRGEEPEAACPVVAYDLAHGARMAAEYLAQRGHRRIALLSSSEQSSELLFGLSAGLAAYGEPPDAAFLQLAAPGVEGAAAATAVAVRREPSARAFFCATDEAAAGALSAMRAAGLAPGRECAVVGFGNTRLARSLRLTSIDPGADRLADRIVTIIREAMGHGALATQRVVVAPELIVRET